MFTYVNAPVWDPSGYAEVSRNLVYGLYNLGMDMSVIPYVNWNLVDVGVEYEIGNVLRQIEMRPGTKIKYDKPWWNIKIPDDFEIVDGRLNIGQCMYEVERIPNKWVGICNEVDELWVPSTFNYRTFTESGVKPEKVKVMPLGVDTDKFTPKAEPFKYDQVKEDDFVFMSNFQWSYRKGYDVLLKSYYQEFGADENVVLILKTYEAMISHSAEQVIKKGIKKLKDDLGLKKYPRVLWMRDLLPTDKVPSLYRSCDCMVLPTRGEGWNLPAIEAMSCGKPVITTNYSAHLDFCNKDNSYLIDINGLEKAKSQMEDIHFGYRGNSWADPSIDHTRELMRHVYDNRDEAEAKGKKARRDILKGFTWKHAALRLYNRFEELM